MSKKVPTPTEIELEAELESLHGEIKKLEQTNVKLRKALEAKIVVTKKIKNREGLKYFPAIMLDIIGRLTKDNYSWASDMYVKYMSLVNYAIVAGIGVVINMFVLYGTVNLFPLFMANGLAILTAFLWNWNFSVGPCGYLFGLSEEKSLEVETTNA